MPAHETATAPPLPLSVCAPAALPLRQHRAGDRGQLCHTRYTTRFIGASQFPNLTHCFNCIQLDSIESYSCSYVTGAKYTT